MLNVLVLLACLGAGLAAPVDVFAWEKHDGLNCWWGGHGADELAGNAPGATLKNSTDKTEIRTLGQCQAECAKRVDDKTGENTECHAVLFQVATGKCYGKKNVDVSKCAKDETVALYVRPAAKEWGGADPALVPADKVAADKAAVDKAAADKAAADKAAADKAAVDKAAADKAAGDKAAADKANKAAADKAAADKAASAVAVMDGQRYEFDSKCRYAEGSMKESAPDGQPLAIGGAGTLNGRGASFGGGTTTKPQSYAVFVVYTKDSNGKEGGDSMSCATELSYTMPDPTYVDGGSMDKGFEPVWIKQGADVNISPATPHLHIVPGPAGAGYDLLATTSDPDSRAFGSDQKCLLFYQVKNPGRAYSKNGVNNGGWRLVKTNNQHDADEIQCN